MHPHPLTMTARQGNPDQYLQKVGDTFYARVRVPRTLEKYIGQSHIRRSLKTGDKAKANRLKHAVVAALKGELEALRTAPKKPEGPGISFAEAKAWRDDLIASENADDEGVSHTVVSDLLQDRAAQIEKLFGNLRASRWIKAATTDDPVSDTLSKLMDDWMGVSDYKASTKAGHRKALSEVLTFLKAAAAIPEDVTRRVAMSYIDTDLTQRSLAHNTIRDRLISLGGFWAWMASRDAFPKGVNPWTGHKVSKQSNKGRSPPKRTYTDAELIQLLSGNTTVKAWPTYSYIPDLMALGLFTGARLESLCALRVGSIESRGRGIILAISNDKNVSGDRPVGVVHPVALAVIKLRTEGKESGDLLFHELKSGGLDEKMSASATKAFSRYRRECGVPDGTDFHSFRRNVITILENEGVGQAPIARFVGHKVGTMAADTYSKGASQDNSLKTARKIRYSAEVEAAVLSISAPLDKP